VATIAAMADRHWDFMGSQSPRCRIIGDCLARIGARTLPLILPRLDDEDEYIRLGLIRALEKLGPAAASARPALEARLADPHFRVRAAAARALKAIAP